MKTVVGLYDKFELAQQAVAELRQQGFSQDAISLVAKDEGGQYSRYLQGDQEGQKQNLGDSAAAGAGIGAVLGGLGGLLVGLGALAIPGIGPIIAAGPIATTLAGAGVGAVAGGVVGALIDLGIPEENAKMYAEGINRGGTLVVVRTDDPMAQQAANILNRFNPIDVDRRASEWNRGQTSSDYSTANRQSAAIPVTGGMDTDMDDSLEDQSRMHPHHDLEEENLQDENIPVTGRDVADTTIPVIEEDIRVGKREVQSGGVRVERTEEEIPFEQDVNLHEEHVNVERRPVNREATDRDFQAFQEGSMELKETTEEPVVEKRARVVEEVDINKDVNDRKETVRDTLHRQDVNIEDQRGQSGMGMSDQDWNMYDSRFRQDWQTRYGASGGTYNEYLPAYRYGYDLGNNQQYRGYDWNRLEPIARQNWERRGGQGAWEDVKDAVKHAWNSVTQR